MTESRFILRFKKICLTLLSFRRDIDVKTVDNGDGTISILFSILEAGEYTVNIKYGGQTIPGGYYKLVAKEYKSEELNSYENHVHETRETRTTEYKETKQQDLREIYLNNIPLLTTGGNVTGESIIFFCMILRIAYYIK